MARQEGVLLTFECDNTPSSPVKQVAGMDSDSAMETTLRTEDLTVCTEALTCVELDSGCSSSVESNESSDSGEVGKVAGLDTEKLKQKSRPEKPNSVLSPKMEEDLIFAEGKSEEEDEEDINDDEIDLDELPDDSNEDEFVDQPLLEAAISAGQLALLPRVSQENLKPILKQRSLSEHIPVKTHRSSWKQLPPPDKSIIRSVSCPDARVLEDQSVRRRAGVSFDAVIIRHYDQTIGDNPSCSYGPPISLDWSYEEFPSLNIDEYESNRGGRRKLRNMVLSYFKRKNVLSFFYEHSEEELKKATKEANRVKRNRAITNALLPTSKVEEVMQSAARKGKRMLGGKKKP